MIACSECLFESFDECPLTQLLNRRHEVHEEKQENEVQRGWEQESQEDSGARSGDGR
jgi:hypothetical protein